MKTEDLAEKLGISKSTMYYLFRSEDAPFRVLRKASEVFDVPFEYWSAATDLPDGATYSDVQELKQMLEKNGKSVTGFQKQSYLQKIERLEREVKMLQQTVQDKEIIIDMLQAKLRN
ncbi:MAG: helix-turn-helix domain-containing protein [Bacteroidetes bacterium]|nr:helix-turn-helix domain-containing protein [Bacteroidota bacterium]